MKYTGDRKSVEPIFNNTIDRLNNWIMKLLPLNEKKYDQNCWCDNDLFMLVDC